jgi:hypothetical protein
MSKPIPTLVTYRPKQGHEDALAALIRAHWPTLDKLGLVTKEPARLWRATDKRTKAVSFVELFSWKDESAPELAHQLPEVMAVWETMGPHLEELTLAQVEPVLA